MASRPTFCFGKFELDPSSFELRTSRRKVHLERSPMELLILLAERQGQLVTREEIIERLWADDIHVDTRQGINTAIHKIRAALGDDPERPQILQTVSGKGYRLIAASPTVEQTTRRKPEPSSTVDSPLREPAKDSRRKPKTWQSLIAGAAILALLAAFLGVMARRVFRNSSTPRLGGNIRSIAVLPLANLSGDPQQEYFADGMTDELITDLAKSSGLRVISRTSVMRYKNTTLPLPQIGKELNVDAVVEGSVARSGERIRATAQLVETSTDRHLWADSYERNMPDVLQLQDDLARAIADQVEEKLHSSGPEHAGPVNPQAYVLYLKGRYFFEERTKAGFGTSIDYFQRAIALDSSYAPAYAGLAEDYGLLGNNRFMPPDDVYPKAKEAALKALQLDPNLAEAHVSLAEILNDYEWNWPAAEKEYRRAIDLNPNDVNAHHWYAMSLAWHGKLGEAIEEIESASQLDPLSMRVNGNVAQIYFWAHDYEGALRKSQSALKIHPEDWGTHMVVGRIYLQTHVYQAAISELRRALYLAPGHPVLPVWLAYGYARTGQKEKAENVLRVLEKNQDVAYVSPALTAIAYVALGERDQAYAALDRAVKEHDTGLLIINVDPAFDPLRSEPRFQRVLRRVGF